MLLGGVILLTSFAYLGILFAIAYYGDKRADAGRSIIANPYIYAFSMAVYATSWTFYGSVGRAAASGVGFLPIYLGPTLMAALWWLVLRKMIRISKVNRITSIADFIAARYGKSALLGGLVTVIAVIGIIPYIALQLKAVSASFLILLQYPAVVMPPKGHPVVLWQDPGAYLPRQFQISVVENVNENHLSKAVWLFPLYLFAINIFVLPITFAGLMHFHGGQVDADTFVLTLPMAHGRESLALFAFIGGLSAATGMVIVETIALSTMICNDLVMPVLLRWQARRLSERSDLSGLLLGIRRGAIVVLMMLGYVYYRAAGEAYALVSIGLVSFAAVAQFAPAMLGGMYWKQGTHAGAFSGLTLGFALWAYTLLLPSFAKSGWLPISFIQQGPFGIEWLKPTSLFGLKGLDDI